MNDQKLKLDLPIVLPDAIDARDRCVKTLVDVLGGRPGVSKAHVVDGAGGSAGLCIHFDAAQTSMSQVRALALQAGADLGERFGHIRFTLNKPVEARAARRIGQTLGDRPGVLQAEVGPGGHGFVEYDRSQTDGEALRGAVRATGAKLVGGGLPAHVHDHPHSHAHTQDPGDEVSTAGVAPGSKAADGKPAHKHGDHDHAEGEEGGDHGHAHGGIFGERTELIFALLCGATLAGGWLLEQRLSGWIPQLAFVLAYIFGGYFTLMEAFENLKRKRFEIDTLMLVAAAGAAFLGQWAEGALLLFLFSIGHALEHYAMGRARRAIEALAELAPKQATVRRGEKTEDIPVEALALGDIVIVRPNERIAADGVVVVGESSVNQAPVTGESVPVDKRPVTGDVDFAKAPAEHRVFAGTINGAGALEVRVARLATETTLARVVKMVAEAEAQRSPTQRFTDKFERIFVPAILAFVGLLMLAFLVRDEPFSASFYRAMAVLVAASPCALAISVPSAVLSGVARAGRGGVLVKGGGPLENLGTLTALAFDKTGTLTEGKPRLTDVVPAEGVDERELLAVAHAVESLSDHPLAAAVVRDAESRLGDGDRLRAEDVKSLTGQGIEAKVNGVATRIGKPALFEDGDGERIHPLVWKDARRLDNKGRTVVVVRHGDRYLGTLGLMDTARPAAKAVIERLRKLGITRMIMLSGDNQSVANAIAKELGLDEARGGLMPEDKVAVIKQLKEMSGKVAMVGDGVNDAPAMANATVGIAMGAAGSDVALETADVALMADDLTHLPFAVGLSRRTSGIIKQNLWVSLGMVAFLIPATLFGLKIGAAVIFHEGSTLLVVGNALRLLAFKDREA
ncbi:MAG: heavy metal translocating P-type ATPase [Caulobacterales bacterium]|nr:heavy metal translocating P-type ATPase [Caulobacterales bacterium]